MLVVAQEMGHRKLSIPSFHRLHLTFFILSPRFLRFRLSWQLFGSWRLRLMPLYKWYVRVRGRGDSNKQQRLA